MQPVEKDQQYGVCPECGADTHRKDDKFVCKNCGYTEEIGE